VDAAEVADHAREPASLDGMYLKADLVRIDANLVNIDDCKSGESFERTNEGKLGLTWPTFDQVLYHGRFDAGG
jgi:hypothetical protein